MFSENPLQKSCDESKVNNLIQPSEQYKEAEHSSPNQVIPRLPHTFKYIFYLLNFSNPSINVLAVTLDPP